MEIRSNIMIKSNIYPKKGRSAFDKDFVRQIRGYEALKRLLEYGSSHENSFTKAQIEERYNGMPTCGLDKSGAKAWGTVVENGQEVYVCKCEKNDCPRFKKCSALSSFRAVERPTELMLAEEDFEKSETGALEMNDLFATHDGGLITAFAKVTQELVAATSTSQAEMKKRPSPPAEVKAIPKVEEAGKQKKAIVYSIKRSTKVAPEHRIADPEPIITSSISDRIIVNAGPGTGKTYSVIQRLKYIIDKELADPEDIWVLCYSRSAVRVIRDRINTIIEKGELSPRARQLFDNIRTFDSFATLWFTAVDMEGTINHLNYDERIEAFIVDLKDNPKDLSGLKYLIVDEIQDLVGVRARMVQAILDHLDPEAGFLLLGDRCQSIYDYQIKDDNELTSAKFYHWVYSRFGNEAKRYELTRNRRQEKEIASMLKPFRNAILAEDLAALEKILGTIRDNITNKNYLGDLRNLEKPFLSGQTAILCRTNAEASIISTNLFKRAIIHNKAKRAQHIDLAPWIGHILSTYTDSLIGKRAFLERALAAGYPDGDAKWELLKSIAPEDDQDVLNIKSLVTSLVAGSNLSRELDATMYDCLTVSTIHRAKGTEYEQVILLEDSYRKEKVTIEEMKVNYVSLTRAKQGIFIGHVPRNYGDNYTLQLDSKRWIASLKINKNRRPFCSRFDVGLPGDVDPFGFVNMSIGDPMEMQNYIAGINPGDPVEVNMVNGNYLIFHRGMVIGKLSDDIKQDLRDAMNKTNRSPNLPYSLLDIHVSNVVTIANTSYREEIGEPFNKSGLWLGVEISGFAKTCW